MLEERQILLCLQDTDLEVREAMLAEEQTQLDRIKGERTTEVGQLS
jgi:hypothetical protein